MGAFAKANRVFAAVSLFAALCGCESLPNLFTNTSVKYSQDAGNVYVSAYPEVPWSDVSASLSPNNDLSITEARDIAASTTQEQISQFLSTFAAALNVSLPTVTKSVTDNITNGVTKTSGTITHVSPEVPTSSGTPATTLPSLTPDFSKALPASAVDGNTLLTEGTALYQYARILDSQIAKQYLPDGYSAHLLTLQVDLQPARRDLAYDAYTDVDFMPSVLTAAYLANAQDSDEEDQAPVVITPLVITDAMETTNVGRSIEALRQAAIQLSGMVYGAGINGGLGGGSERNQTITGLDKNSLVTVGRITDHTVRIRIGAENSGSHGLALVPRAYNVSFMVLVRDTQQAKSSSDTPELSIVAHTEFRPVDGGATLLEGRDRKKLAQTVDDTVRSFGFHAVDDCEVKSPNEIDGPLNLLRAVDEGDYRTAFACIVQTTDLIPVPDNKKQSSAENALHPIQMNAGLLPSDKPDTSGNQRPNVAAIVRDMMPTRRTALTRLFQRLVEIQDNSRYSTMHVALKVLHATLPPAQTVIYADDKQSKTVFYVRGGKDLDATKLRAVLTVNGRATTVLYPTDLRTVLAAGSSEVDVTTPSLAKFKLTGRKLLRICSESSKVCAAYETFLTAAGAPGNPHGGAAPAGSSIPNPVTTSEKYIVSDSTNHGLLTLKIGEMPADKSFTAPFYVNVTSPVGEFASNSTAGQAKITSKGIALTGSSVLVAYFQNLIDKETLTLTTVDSTGKDVGKPLNFTVKMSPPRKGG